MKSKESSNSPGNSSRYFSARFFSKFSRRPSLTLILCVIAAITLAIASLGRLQWHAADSEKTSSDVSHSVAHAALQFDYTQASSFLFSAHDPASGDLWTTRMLRKGDAWQIALAPDGRVLGDTRANGNWILHVLDTVRTAQIKEVPVSGTLESFGLSDPRVLLQWSLPGADQVYELRLGSPAQDAEGHFEGVYARIAMAPGESPELKQTVYSMQGALLKMLEMISNFDSLRLKTLATFVADDVDTLTIDTSDRKAFHSERTPDDWKATPFLEQLCHLRIENFVDDLPQNSRLNQLIKDQPIYVLHLGGRDHFQEEIRFAADAGRVYASTSSRKVSDSGPLSVFEIPPEILGALAVLLR